MNNRLLAARFSAAAMAVLAVLPGMLILGCEGDGLDPWSRAEDAPVALQPGRTLAGMGWVNDWCWVPEDLLREQVEAMAACDWDAYLIEMGGAARWHGHDEAEAREVIAERYPFLVDLLAEHGMLLLNSVQNDNAGLGKYGDKSKPLRDQTEFSAWLVGLVAAVGRPDVVMVQPVAETKTEAGRDLETLCASVLTNFTLVNNADSRPEDKPDWAEYNATHPFSVAAVAREDIVVNDTSTAIIELDANGNMSGALSPAQVVRYIAACIDAQALLAGIYVFDAGAAPAVDYPAIEAILGVSR